MNSFFRLFGFLGLIIFCQNCNRHLYIDRSQFIKDGEPVPTVDLNTYKSVQLRPNQDPDLAVAMAISGGGSRASNFGIGIMLGLEQIQVNKEQDVLDQVDYLSTVSGGGFAGGALISALYDHQLLSPDLPFQLSYYLDRNIRKDLSISFTNALLKGYFIPKTWVSALDYGDNLEQTINDNVLGFKRREKAGFNQKILLRHLFVPKTATNQSVKFPMHITNSTAMGTLAIFPFTPDILEKHSVNGYTHDLKTIETDNIDPYQIPLSVGIKASGSFPVLVPNTTLNSKYEAERPFLHIMDGAMSDNQGFYTALSILQQDLSSKKVLLIVDADASGNLYTFSKRKEANPPLKVFLSLAASGLYARRATLKQDLSVLGDKFGIKPVFLSFHTLIEDIPVPEGLPEKIDIKEEQMRFIEILKQKPVDLSNVDRHILYELLINIGTKYTIKPNEQELLFLSGQYITSLAKLEIMEALQP